MAECMKCAGKNNAGFPIIRDGDLVQVDHGAWWTVMLAGDVSAVMAPPDDGPVQSISYKRVTKVYKEKTR